MKYFLFVLHTLAHCWVVAFCLEESTERYLFWNEILEVCAKYIEKYKLKGGE